MIRRLRPRSVYDLLAAVAFLVLVAGGSAYAAATIGAANIKDDAVLSRHVKDGQVRATDLAPGSVGTGKVLDGSLLARDAKSGQLPARAISFNTHLGVNRNVDTPYVNGIKLGLACRQQSDTPLAISVFQQPGTELGLVSGTYSRDGAQLLDVHSPNGFRFSSPGSGLDVDVVIRVVPGKWTGFQLHASYAGASKGCQFGGRIEVPTN
jgi:hypothetical protein